MRNNNPRFPLWYQCYHAEVHPTHMSSSLIAAAGVEEACQEASEEAYPVSSQAGEACQVGSLAGEDHSLAEEACQVESPLDEAYQVACQAGPMVAVVAARALAHLQIHATHEMRTH